ncbi:hypothetical protein [Streptomyces sp. NPDC004546]|uniref:hypothetical protein n=1 Tax=unclassified Streptomyces TaxID=2593676 RepID=UPI0033B0C90A
MRPLSVPVRLTVTVLTLAAAAGCVNVGDDAGRARPSHSAGQRGGEAPDGGPGDGAGGLGGHDGKAGDRKHEHGGKKKPGEESASPSATSSSGEGDSPAAPAKPGPGSTGDPGGPAPTNAPPTPPATSAPPEPPASTPPPATSEPPSAEPSSSAHEGTGTQLVEREPAPAPGADVAA